MAFYRQHPITPLRTERLLLRPLEEADAPRIQALFPNPNQLRYMNAAIPWPYPEDGALSFVRGAVERIAGREEYFWAITTLEDGLVGVISLTPESEEDNRGFWLAEEFWGRGYMTEAVLAVTDFAFDTLEMEELFLSNAEPNRASHRLKEKAGAEIVVIQDQDYIGGRFPGVKWRLTREAWRANRHHFKTS